MQEIEIYIESTCVPTNTEVSTLVSELIATHILRVSGFGIETHL